MKHVSVALCICVCMAVVLFRSMVYDIPAAPGLQPVRNNDPGAEQNGITIHYHDRRPYYLGYQGQVHGLVADPVAMVFATADIDFEWEETPAGRQLEIIAANQSPTCAAGWFKTPERERYARYTLPIYQDQPFVGVTRSENVHLDEEETLAGVFREKSLRLLVKSGYSYGSYIDGKIAELQPRTVRTTGDNAAMLLMLLNNRADYGLMAEEEVYDLMLLSGFDRSDFKIVRFGDVPAGNKRYLICSRKVTEDVMNRLDGAIARLRKGGEAADE